MKRKEFIETVRRQLIQRRAELLDDVSGDESLLNSLHISSEPGDSADHATDNVAGEISAQLADVEFREIANIDNALCRISDQTYGICEGCRKNIPLNRLRAILHASFCIGCKRLAEEHDIESGSDTDWSAILGTDGSFSGPDASVS
ncbi:TraR/DksA family transcriptional regulator [Mariniblastus fucicola]|uniref:RNA polymerase-binding transcription factor DksA n=1 Tax=Mariniblastus fucicola TaxID=980251 RepID=A0A5B9PH14_9BACT|nr:TraR/DksA family transcriptional regulator [Mariniblastus fucicola]QEG24560.1 RNA polymerase-binding transcription factor DksA [Mariniblastus fucicola]